MVHAAASIAVRDGAVRALGEELGEREERRWIRVMVVVVLVLAYAVAVFYQGTLVYLLLTAYGAVVQFMPGVVAALYWRRATGVAVLTGLLGGAPLTMLFVFFPGLRPFPLHAGLYGLGLNVLLLGTISLKGRTKATSRDDEFLAAARGDRAAEL